MYNAQFTMHNHEQKNIRFFRQKERKRKKIACKTMILLIAA